MVDPTYWNCGSGARVVSRLATWQIGLPGRFHYMVPNLHEGATSDDLYLCTTMKSETRDGLDEGFDVYRMAFRHESMLLPTHAQGLLVLSGGVPACYDGERLSEYGFHLHPLITDPPFADTGGGELTADTEYSYVAIYTWLDSRGVRHRSWPSSVVKATTGDGVGPHYITLQVWCCTLTEHEDPENESQLVEIEIYRAGGTSDGLFHLDQVLANDRTTWAIPATSTISDADIEEKEILYTDGGVLFDLCPPAAHHIAQNGDRLWLVSADNPEYLWISKIDDRAATMPGFAGELVARTDVGHGVVACASMDDKLVALKRRSIIVYVGNPPNDQGVGGNLNGPTSVTVQAGCTEPRSVAVCPAGVVFRGADGIHLLTRGMTVQKVSSPVEDVILATSEVTSAVCWEELSLVLFTLDSGVTLVWHYEINEWTTWHTESDGFWLTLDGTGAAGAGAVASLNLESTSPTSHVFWTNAAPDGTRRAVISKCVADATRRGSCISMDTLGELRFELIHDLAGGDRIDVVSDDPVLDGNVHLVVITYDGSGTAAGVTMLVDGVAVATTTLVDALTGTIQGGGFWWIGFRAGMDYLIGSVGPVAVYEHALTQAQIDDIYERDTYLETLLLGLWYPTSLDDYPILTDHGPSAIPTVCVAGSIFEYARRAIRVPGRPKLVPTHAALCWRDGGYSYHQAYQDCVRYAYEPSAFVDNKHAFWEGDGLTRPTLVVTTPWLQLAGVQNFQRCRMVRLHAKWSAPHDLKIELLHDFEDTVETTETFTSADVFGLLEQFREQVSIHVPRQRCEAIRVRISSTSTANPGVLPVRFESLGFEFGKEPGLAPLAIPARK